MDEDDAEVWEVPEIIDYGTGKGVVQCRVRWAATGVLLTYERTAI